MLWERSARINFFFSANIRASRLFFRSKFSFASLAFLSIDFIVMDQNVEKVSKIELPKNFERLCKLFEAMENVSLKK